MKKLNKKGFTIVELVIVIAVIAILAAVLIPTFATVITKANQSAALQEAKNAYTEDLAAFDGKYTAESYGVDVEGKGTVNGITLKGKITFDANFAVTKYEFTASNGIKCTYNPAATPAWTYSN